jgi:hypothetical protein
VPARARARVTTASRLIDGIELKLHREEAVDG